MATGNNKKSGCGCLSILAVIALTAGSIYYWRGELLGKKLTPLEAAEAVPQKALLTSYISTDSKDWSQLSKFGTPDAQKVFGKKLDELKGNLSNQDINYEQDIQPWLGGVMLAAMPSNVSQDSHILIVAGIKNKLKALDFQKKFKDQPNYNSTQTDYQGITITTVTHQNSTPFSFANVGNYLLIADNNQTIEQSIDTLKGSPSYSEKPGAKQALSQKLTLKHPVAQVYIVDYGTLLEEGLRDAAPNVPLNPNTFKQIKQVESLVVGVGLEDQGLHFQSIVKYNPSTFKPSVSLSPNKVLEKFPIQSFAVINGKAIKDGWTNLVNQAQNDPDLQTVVDQIREGFRYYNLDADKEVFGWLDGEYALGMVFNNQSSIPQFGVGGMVVLQTSDRATADNTFTKIDQIAKMYNVSVEPNQVNGIDVTNWKVEQENVLLSRGWLDNQSLAMTIIMPFSTATDVKAKESLALSPNFRAITDGLPKKNLGYFYLDLNQMVNEFAKLQGNTLDSESRAMLDTLQGLALTVTMPDQTSTQFDMLLALKSKQ